MFPANGTNFRTLTPEEAAPILSGWLRHAASAPTLAGRLNERTPQRTPYAPIMPKGRR